MIKFTYGQNFLKSIKNVNTKWIDNTRLVTEKFETKIKGTIVENWVKYWKNVLIDYREAFIDVGKDIKQKPVKAVCVSSILGSIAYCCKHNPDQINFRDALVKCENQLLLVHPTSQNSEASQHLKYVEQCYNNRSIRRLNIGVASVMWTDYYSQSCSNYTSTCPHIQIEYSKFKNRILDIGFLDRWWILTSKMENYDVNY